MPNKVYRTDGTGTHECLPERTVDKDVWARIDQAATRYKLVWLFWGAIASAGGWLLHNYLEPIAAVPVLQAQQIVILKRLDKVDSTQSETTQILKVFGKFICKQMTEDDRYKYDIDCKKLPAPAIIQQPPGSGT